MHERLQMYTFLERKSHEKYNGDIKFSPKITILEKITKKTRFLPFFFQNRLQKIEILKTAFKLFYWLKTFTWMLRFFFENFCWFF